MRPSRYCRSSETARNSSSVPASPSRPGNRSTAGRAARTSWQAPSHAPGDAKMLAASHVCSTGISERAGSVAAMGVPPLAGSAGSDARPAPGGVQRADERLVRDRERAVPGEPPDVGALAGGRARVLVVPDLEQVSEVVVDV